MPRNTQKFAIRAVPKEGDWKALAAMLSDIKMALESLIGQGKSAAPHKEKAVTGQNAIDLGLATENELRTL